MTITDAQCYRYALPLREPLSLEETTVAERRGVLLRLEGEGGGVGWGDAAPLPGFSAETLADATRALSARGPTLRGPVWPVGEGEESARPDWFSEVPPSVRFALDSAMLELRAADAENGSVGTILGSRTDPVALNALIPAEHAEGTTEARRLRRAGFRAVKLKVGRAPIETDVARVEALHEALGPSVALRLDANRAWSLDQACTFASALEETPVEYIEEPLTDPGRLPEFTERTGLPVALDETTREWSPSALASMGRVAAVILKPTLLGGLSAARRWALRAQMVGASAVVSSSYESGVGTRVLVALAAAVSDGPVGLSAYTQLDDDVLRPRLALGGPTVDPEQVFRGNVQVSRLTPIEAQ